MEFRDLRETVLEKYYPDKEEISEVKDTYEKISEFIEIEFGLKTHFAGSASRSTCLSGDKDIDIFVLFPEGTNSDVLEEKGLEIGKKVFEEFGGNYEVDYAEHPYTKGDTLGHEVEIVPCIDTDPESITSSVDRTPHHSRWVKKNLDNTQRKDVVLLKQFLRANDLYGSSLKVEGFSGYLCEVLIAEYGSFEHLIDSVPKWKEGKIIDAEKHHEDLSDKLEKKFKREPLVVIDPVDPERNVASVLSEENLSKFIYCSWQLKSDPKLELFEQSDKDHTEFDIKQELKSRADLLVMEFENVEKVDDVVYPQLRKTLERITSELEKRDFRIFESGFHIGEKTRIFLELERELPKIKHQRGPKVYHGTDHLAEFTSKYDNVFIEGSRVFAKIEREFSDAKNFIKSFLDSDLESKGVPKNVAEELEAYSFIDPLDGGEKWFNYLGERFHVNKK